MEDKNMEIEEITGSLSFTCLPDHIWEMIFSYSLNLKNVVLTCKYFNDLISKSREVMSLMSLVLKDTIYNDHENIAAILKSESKISCVKFQLVSAFGCQFYKVLDHFKKYIREVKFGNNVQLSPIVLIDLFEMLQNLEELDINYGVNLIDPLPVVTVVFENGRKLKKVDLGDAKILKYMPEIEELACHTRSLDSTIELKKYLESHDQLKKLTVYLGSSDNFPAITLGDIHLELESFILIQKHERQSHVNNNAINFVRSQAESLKYLDVDSFICNLDIIQELLNGMEELETLYIWGDVRPPTTEFVERNFECSKMKELLITGKFEYPGLFRKLPNLETFSFIGNSAATVDSAVQNCRNLSKLTIEIFIEAFQNAIFPKLSELTIYNDNIEGSEFIFENFLGRHPKLSRLELSYTVKKEILWKLPALLPNLVDFGFVSFKGFDEDDLKELLSSWESIKKLRIVTKDQRKIDLKAATNNIARRLIVCQSTRSGENIFSK
jgi:Leucine-rich repeat (LRR) protein